MEDDRDMVIEFDRIFFVRKLSGRKMLKFIRAGTSVCVALVVIVLMRCIFWSMFLVGDKGGVLRKRFLVGWNYHLQVRSRFCGGGDDGTGSIRAGYGIGGGVSYKAGLEACELGDLLLMVFESDGSGKKCIQSWWACVLDSGVSRFCEFFYFGLLLFGEDDGKLRCLQKWLVGGVPRLGGAMDE